MNLEQKTPLVFILDMLQRYQTERGNGGPLLLSIRCEAIESFNIGGVQLPYRIHSPIIVGADARRSD